MDIHAPCPSGERTYGSGNTKCVPQDMDIMPMGSPQPRILIHITHTQRHTPDPQSCLHCPCATPVTLQEILMIGYYEMAHHVIDGLPHDQEEKNKQPSTLA